MHKSRPARWRRLIHSVGASEYLRKYMKAHTSNERHSMLGDDEPHTLCNTSIGSSACSHGPFADLVTASSLRLITLALGEQADEFSSSKSVTAILVTRSFCRQAS